jgi:hypothetical protein
MRRSFAARYIVEFIEIEYKVGMFMLKGVNAALSVFNERRRNVVGWRGSKIIWVDIQAQYNCANWQLG